MKKKNTKTEAKNHFHFFGGVELGEKELSKISLDDLLEKEFEFITTANQTDWRYGDFSFDLKQIKEMVKNFNDNVLGTEVAVDLNHQSQGGAYAWILPGSMRVGPSTRLEGQHSVFGKLYRFTPEGEKLVTTGQFRYFSLEIRHKLEKFVGKTKKVFKNVIQGIALTNRPVIKDMAPIFSEDNNNQSFNSQDMELFLSMLKELSEKDVVVPAEKNLLKKAFATLSEEEQSEVQEEVEAVEAKEELTEEEKKAAEEAEAAKEKAEEEAKAALSEVERKFSEEASEAKAAAEAAKKELASKTEELEAFKFAQREAAAKEAVEGLMLSEYRSTGFSAESKEKLVEFTMGLSTEQRETFVALLGEQKTADLSEYGVTGGNQTQVSTSLSAEEQIAEIAKKLSVEKDISIKEATDLALSENPELAKQLS